MPALNFEIILKFPHFLRSADFNCWASLWHHGVVLITTAQLHSTKPELRFCAGSNPAHSVWEIRNGDDL